MNKIRIIDLLNLMVIGEDLPKKIRYEDEEYYLTSDEETYIGCISHSAIGRRHCLEQCLTDEIEIIEENKSIGTPIFITKESTKNLEAVNSTLVSLRNTINNLVNAVNELEKENE